MKLFLLTILILISISTIVLVSGERQILVEEHKFGNITSYYELEEPIPFDRTTDCISPKKVNNSSSSSTQGYTFQIILPDNEYCWLSGVFLSLDNYTAMQNNVGVFTVRDRSFSINTQQHTYCELALWIWNGQTVDYQKKLENLTQYMFPEYCYQEIPTAIIPEYGKIASLILAISIIGTIAVVMYQKKSYRY